MAEPQTSARTPEEAATARRPRIPLWQTALPVGMVFVLVLVLLLRPLYERSARHRAETMRAEALSLRGSQSVNDWARLVELTQASAAWRFPRPLSWLFVASINKVAAYDVATHGVAAGVLREIIFADKAAVARGLNCGVLAVSEWVWKELAPKLTRVAGDPPNAVYYDDVLTWLWVGGGQDAVRLFVVNGTTTGPLATMPIPWSDPSRVSYAKRTIRYQTLQALMVANPAGAFPVISEFFERNPGAPDAGSFPIYGIRQWYDKQRPIMRAAAARFHYDLVGRNRILTPLLAVWLRSFFACGGALPTAFFEQALKISDPVVRYLVISQAANGRLLKPHRLWMTVLTDKDPRCRVIAARVLGYEKAREAADALAGLDKGGRMDVAIQMAWSLAAMGDPRGRPALERLEGILQEGERLYRTRGFAERPPFFDFPPAELWDPTARPLPLPNTVTMRAGSDIVGAILAYMDEGGTIPLTISRWPRWDETMLVGEPAPLVW